jgi:hypothetical protein
MMIGKSREYADKLYLTLERIFVPRDMWIDSAKKQCISYKWGGRAEQEWLAQIRKESTERTAEKVT